MRLVAVLALAAAAAVAGPAGCSWFNSDPPPPCPRAFILSDGSSVTQFKDGPGRDLTDVQYEAQIAEIKSACKFAADAKGKPNQIVGVQVNATLTALRGPALPAATVEVPFFVAVTDRQRMVLQKVTFNAKFVFEQGKRRAAVLEETESLITIEEGRQSRDYQIVVGLQLTEDQLQYNRVKRGE